VQLNYGFDVATCRQIADSIGANALYLHLNPLQEVVQAGGNTNFRGLLAKIGAVCQELGLPVLVKEVGNGLAPDTAVRLATVGVSALDVAGAGGTSWARIEGQRAPDPLARNLGDVFRDWGLPTSEALRLCRAELPTTPLVASGGIRTGVDIAKAIALGADLTAMALPFLKAATETPEQVEAVIDRLVTELKVTMFCLGCRTITDLRHTNRLREVG